MKCDILDDSYEMWHNITRGETQTFKTLLCFFLNKLLLLLQKTWIKNHCHAVWNESENRNRNVFFPFPLALFIQVQCGRVHKFCGGDICFSKAQYRSHTQGSEVQTLVFLMHAQLVLFYMEHTALLLSLIPASTHFPNIKSFVWNIEHDVLKHKQQHELNLCGRFSTILHVLEVCYWMFLSIQKCRRPLGNNSKLKQNFEGLFVIHKFRNWSR